MEGLTRVDTRTRDAIQVNEKLANSHCSSNLGKPKAIYASYLAFKNALKYILLHIKL
jgi:hypothetical protein